MRSRFTAATGAALLVLLGSLTLTAAAPPAYAQPDGAGPRADNQPFTPHSDPTATDETGTAGNGTAPAATIAAGCTADFEIKIVWAQGFGFTAEVTVTADLGPINDWAVTWSFVNGETITTGWNAIYTVSGASVTATNTSWNGSLAAGASTTFGFVGAWQDFLTEPAVTCTAG
jgi:cellulase/cellobiase CelA1